MKAGENWRKSDTNLSLWEHRLRCRALKADGMRTAKLGFLDYELTVTLDTSAMVLSCSAEHCSERLALHACRKLPWSTKLLSRFNHGLNRMFAGTSKSK